MVGGEVDILTQERHPTVSQMTNYMGGGVIRVIRVIRVMGGPMLDSPRGGLRRRGASAGPRSACPRDRCPPRTVRGPSCLGGSRAGEVERRGVERASNGPCPVKRIRPSVEKANALAPLGSKMDGYR